MDLKPCDGCGAETFNRIDGKWCVDCKPCVWCCQPLGDETCPNGGDICVDCCVKAGDPCGHGERKPIPLDLVEGLVLDLVTMQQEEAIELGDKWPTAQRLVDWYGALSRANATGHGVPMEEEEPYDFTTDHHHYRKVPGGTVPASIDDCQLCAKEVTQ